MNIGRKKLHSIFLLSLAFLSLFVSFISFTNKIIYAQEFNNAEEAAKYAQTVADNPSGKFDLNSDFTGVFVNGTSYVLEADTFYSGQGMYSVDNITKRVVYCLDPTILVGSGVSYSQIMEVNKNTFYDLTLEQQKDALVIGYIANELYSQEMDEKFLVAGQLLIWDAIGYDLVSSTGINSNIYQIKEMYTKEYDSLSEKLYSDKGESSLLDTSGQDLLLLENAPVIDLDNIGVPEENSVPVISSSYNIYQTDVIPDGTTELLNVDDLSIFDFNISATDKEDGDITSKVTADFSAVNTLEYGKNEINLAVEDSSGNIVEKTEYLYIVGEDYVISPDQKIILNSSNIILEMIDTGASIEELAAFYVQEAGIFAYYLETGEEISTVQQILDITYFGESVNTREASDINNNAPAIITVKNSAEFESSAVEAINYIFVTGESNTAQENPYLKAENITLNAGDTYSDDLLNAVAYDIKDGYITENIVYDSSLVDMSKPGVYPVKLSVTDSEGNVSTSIAYVSVTDENGVIVGDVFLHGKTIYTDVKTLTDNQVDLDTFVKTNGDVYSFDMTTGEALDVTTDTTNLVGVTKPGAYSVVLESTNGVDVASKSIDVVVTNDGEIVPDDAPYLYAENVIVDLAKGEVYDKRMHNVFGYDRQDGDLTNSVQIDSTSVNATKPGVYPVNFKVTDANGNSKELSKTVTIIDGNGVIVGDVYLSGQTIYTDMSTITAGQSNLETFVLENGDVFAYDIMTGESLSVSVDTTNLVDITKPGAYSVGLESTNGVDTAAKTIDVVVTNDGEVVPEYAPYLYAENVVVDLSAGESYDQAMHNVFAYDRQDGNITSAVSIDSSLVVSDVVSVYPVDFAVTDSSVMTANLTRTVAINDDNSVISPDGEVILNGHDFSMQMSDYLLVSDYNQLVFDKAELKAFDTITGAAIIPTFETTNITGLTKPGVYEIDVAATNGNDTALKTINLLLLEDEEEYPVDDENPYLYATNGVISAETTADEFDYLITNNAFAYDNQDGILTSLIDADLSKVSFGVAGTYPIELSVTDKDDNVTTKTVDLTIVAEFMELSASDAIISQGDVYDVDSIGLHGAVATDTDGSDISAGAYIKNPSRVNTSIVGIYPVEICVDSVYTASYTECVNQNVVVLKDGEVVDPELPYLYAENILVDLDQGQAYDEAMHNGFAYDMQDGVLTDSIIYESSQVKEEVGVYPVDISVTDSDNKVTTKQNYATIIDDSVVLSPEGEVMLSASNIYTDVSTITDNLATINDFIVAEGKVLAQETDTGSVLTPEIIQNVGIEAKPGIYPVTINAAHTVTGSLATKTIDVVVTADGEVIDEDAPYLYAESVVVNTALGETYSNNLHNAFAYDKQDGNITSNIVITESVDEAVIGVYPVDFEITDSSLLSNQVNKTATIIDDSVVISPDGDVMLSASNIYTDVTTISNNLFAIESFIETEGNVTAIETDTAKVLVPTYESDELIEAKPGVYPVTISAEHSTSGDIATKTIDVVVTADGEVVPEDDPYLYAASVIVDMSKEETYDAALHNSFAYDKQDGNLTDSIAINGTVDDTVLGVYPVTFEVTDSSTTTANLSKTVTIIDDSVVISPEGDVMLSASNIYTDVTTITNNLSDIESFIETEGNVIALETDTANVLTPTYALDKLIEAKPGVYPVEITATHSVTSNTATKTIDVVVTPDDEEVPTDGTPYIYAENVVVDTTLGETYSTDLHNGFAYDREDGLLTNSMSITQNVDEAVIGIYPVDFDVTDSSLLSNQVSKTATIIDDSVVISPDGDVMLSASNIYTDVSTIDSNLSTIEEFITVEGKIIAIETDTGSKLTPTFAQADLIEAKPGVYPVIVSAEHKISGDIATKTIDVVVTPDDEEVPTDGTPYIYAENVVVDTTLGETYSTDLHNGFAYDREDGLLTNSMSITQNVDEAVIGIYPVDFDVTDSSLLSNQVSKTATIIDDSVVISPDGDVMLAASNIYTDVSTIDSNLSTIEEFITVEGKIIAIETDTGSKLTPTFAQADLIEAKPGVYPVIVSAEHKTSGDIATKTIDVVVTPDDEEVPTDGTPYIYAENVVVDTTLGETYSTDLHNGFAYDREDGLLTNSMSITQNVDVSVIGVYPVDFSITDSTGNNVVINKTATIIDDSVVISPNGDVMLAASNIYTDVSTIDSNLSTIEEFIVAEGKVLAQETDTGFILTPSIEQDELIQAKPGVYPVTISAEHRETGDIATKTIDVVVTADGEVIPEDAPYIYASAVLVDTTKGETYDVTTDLDVVQKHNGFAYDREDGNLTSIMTTTQAVDDTVIGVYPVDFEVTDANGNTQELSKNATVIDGNGVISGDVYLSGETIYTDLAKITAAQTNLENFVITNGNVISFDMVTAEKLTVDVDTTNLIGITTPGAYAVVLESTNGVDSATKSIDVVVTADGEVVPTDGSPYLYAESIVIDLYKGETYDEALHNAFAYDREDGNLTSKISIDSKLVVEDTLGVYPVDFDVIDSSLKTNNLTKTVTVIDENSEISPNGEVVLNGHDFSMHMSDYLKITDFNKMVLDNAELSAFDMLTGDTLVPTFDVSDISSLTNPGAYSIIIEATNGTDVAEKTITFLLLEDEEEYPVDDENPYLYAIDGTISTDITNETYDYYTTSNAFAYDNQDGILTDDIQVDTSSVNFGTKGTYPVEFNVTDIDGNKTSKTVNLTIISDVLEITASDVIITQGDVYDVSSVELHNPIAVDTDGADISGSAYINDVSEIDSSVIGIYPVEICVDSVFTASYTECVTQNVIVLKEGEVIDPNLPYLYTEDVLVDLELNDVYDVSMHNAFAYDMQDGVLTDMITSVTSAVKDVVGVYPVDFEVSDSDNQITTNQSHVTVIDDSVVISPNDDVMLSASNIYTDVSSITNNLATIEEFIVAEGKVLAQETDTGNVLTPTIVQDVDIEAKPGVYPVTISATHSVSLSVATKTIDVVVTDDGEVVPDDGTPYIYASDVLVDTTKGETYDVTTDLDVVQKHGGFAYDREEGNLTSSITTTQAVDDTVIGVYPVEFSVTDISAKTADITKHATVIDDSVVISPEGDVMLSASNIYTDVTTITNNLGDIENYISTAGNVSAIETDTAKVIDPSYVQSIEAKPGVYPVRISAEHTNGHTATKTIDVVVTKDDEVVPTDTPYIYADNIELHVGDTYDGLTNHDVFAYDRQDGNLTSSVTVASTTVNTANVGVDNTIFTVTDNSSNTSDYIADVAVLEVGENVPTDGSPYVYGTDVTVGVDSVYSEELLNGFAFDFEDGDLTSDIVYNPASVDTSVIASTDVTLDVVDSDTNAATTKTVVVEVKDVMSIIAEETVTNEDTINANLSDLDKYLLENMGVGTDLVIGKDEFTGETFTATVSDKSSLTDAIASNDGLVPFGVYPISFTSDSGVNVTTDTFNLVVLPGVDVMPTDGTPYIYATDVSVSVGAMEGDSYSTGLHNVLAYDLEDGVILNGLYTATTGITVEESVDQEIGGDYPVIFGVTDSKGNVGADYEATATVRMNPINFDYKINAMNLDMKFVADMTPYATSLFDYQLIIREGSTVGEGAVVGTPVDINNESSIGELIMIPGYESLLMSDMDYNIGIYEIGTETYMPDREEFISGSAVKTPQIDPGTDGNIYSNDLNSDLVLDDLDNFSYIEDVYDFESIGYEEDPQAGRVEFHSGDTTNIYTNDLTIAKYQRLYRPFNGNYILRNDIDGSVAKNDTRADYLGGFGSDGFKPVGYKFGNTAALNGGVGYSSIYSKGFSGKFDGNGFAINNLFIDRGTEDPSSASSFIGIFGMNDDLIDSHAVDVTPNIYSLDVIDAEIIAPKYEFSGILVGQNFGYLKDINVSGDVSGGKWLGGVVGMNGDQGGNTNKKLGGRIEYTTFAGNIYNTDVVSSDNNSSGAGGIAGHNGQLSTVKYSSTSGTVDGDDNIAGLVGHNHLGYVGNSFSSSDVICDSNSCGGLIGYNEGSTAIIEKSYFTGSLSDGTRDFGANNYYGGITGFDAGKTQYTYATGDIFGGENQIGGIAGNGQNSDGSIALNDITADTTSNVHNVNGIEGGAKNAYYKETQSITLMDGTQIDTGDDVNKNGNRLTMLELSNSNKWLEIGYLDSDWDFSPLTNGNAPLLKGEDGTLLPNQVEVPMQ